MYQSFRSDAESETKGIVIDYGDFRVTIARAGGANKRYQRILEVKTRPYRRAIQTDNFDNERAATLLREVYAECVVLNWEVKNGTTDVPSSEWSVGIEGPDGITLPFNKENVLKTFDALPDLFTDIMEQAQKAALFRASLREEAAGNSSGASSTH